MRDTSSRSSTSRTQVADLALHHLAGPDGHRVLVAGGLQQVDGVQQRGERIAQLVPQRGEELVLAPVGEPQRLLGRGRAPPGVRGSGTAGSAPAARSAPRSPASPARTGRSSSVTLPSCCTASFDSAESAPGRVSTSTGRSDQGGCAASTARSAAVCAGDAPPPGSRMAPAPAVSSSISSSNDRQTSRRIPSGDSMASVVAASRDVAARNSSRRSWGWSAVTRRLCRPPESRAPRRPAPRSARRGSRAAARRW